MIERINHASEQRSILSSYFSTLNQILVFIDKANIEDKNVYINILKSLLSVREQILIYSFYLSLGKDIEFRHLIDQYGICNKIKDWPLIKIIGQEHGSINDVL